MLFRSDVLNMVGPPSMARVSGQAGPGQDTTEWTICLECYVLLIKFISNLQHVSGAVDRRSWLSATKQTLAGDDGGYV